MFYPHFTLTEMCVPVYLWQVPVSVGLLTECLLCVTDALKSGHGNSCIGSGLGSLCPTIWFLTVP